jgi:hypothetical protein
LPEYQNYDWRKSTYENDCPIRAARQTKEFEQLLLKSLSLNPPKTKLIILNTAYPYPVYVLRVTKRFVKYTKERAEAKIFKYKEEAENLTKCFSQLKTVEI